MPDALQLPDDLQRGLILLSMHGQEHLWIENFRGLSSYSSEEVRILIRGGWVKICGSHMEILTYTKEEIEAAIEALGRGASIRGEALTLEEFAKLADLLSECRF